MLKELIKLANELDQRGLTEEADALDQMVKSSQFAGYRPSGIQRHPAYPGDPGDKALQQQSKWMDQFEEVFEKSGIDWIQNAFSVLGLVPGYGEPFDAINSAVYAVRGKPLDAVLSAISVIPVYGDFIGKGSLVLLRSIQAGKNSIELGTKTYTVAGLAGELKAYLLKVNEEELKVVLNQIDKAVGKEEGRMFNIYIKQVKEEIDKAAMA